MTPNGLSPSPSPFGSPLFRSLSNEDEAGDPHGLNASLSPFSSPASPSAVALTVADVLPQLPPEVARATSIPQDQPVQISPQILSQALSSGQLAIPLFEVYRVCPGIFQTPVSPDDTRMVRLPAAKLPALISSASAASSAPAPANPGLFAGSLLQPATPPPAPASPFQSLLSDTPPAPADNSVTPRPGTTLPPRRDPSHPPASSIPPNPFLDITAPSAGSPAAASPFGLSPIASLFPTEPQAPAATPEPPPSPFPSLPASPFGQLPQAPPAASPPQTPAPAASPFGFNPFQAAEQEPTPPPAPAASASPFTPSTLPSRGPKIVGAAAASVSALLQGQSADALGFDPAMVPSWIMTHLHGGIVAELQDMPAPSIELGCIVDGITDVGFRNVLNSARRTHDVPVPLSALTPVNPPASPGSTTAPSPLSVLTATPPANALANPFAPAPTPAPLTVEPGNPFSAVPDAPSPSPSPFLPASPLPQAELAPPAPLPAAPDKPASPGPIQPTGDIFGIIASVVSPASAETAAPVNELPPVHSKPATPSAFAPHPMDPFAPSEGSSGDRTSGFSSFDLLGGTPLPDVQPHPLFPAEPESTDTQPASLLPEIPLAPEPAAEPRDTPTAAKPAFSWPADDVAPPTTESSSLFKFLPTPAEPPSAPESTPEQEPAADLAETPSSPTTPTMPAQTLSPRSAAPSKPFLGLSTVEPASEEQILLRALLDTDETLSIERVVDLAAELPGIAACALVRDGQVIAGSSTKGSEAKAFRTQAAQVAQSLRTLAPLIGIADAETFTLNTDSRLITLCFPGAVTLGILHDREPTLGLRDKLTLIARQLDRMVAQR